MKTENEINKKHTNLVKAAKGKICDQRTDLDFPLTLIQHTKNTFRVIYGLEDNGLMNYSTAARAYGECLMHALACAGNLQND